MDEPKYPNKEDSCFENIDELENLENLEDKSLKLDDLSTSVELEESDDFTEEANEPPKKKNEKFLKNRKKKKSKEEIIKAALIRHRLLFFKLPYNFRSEWKEISKKYKDKPMEKLRRLEELATDVISNSSTIDKYLLRKYNLFENRMSRSNLTTSLRIELKNLSVDELCKRIDIKVNRIKNLTKEKITRPIKRIVQIFEMAKLKATLKELKKRIGEVPGLSMADKKKINTAVDIANKFIQQTRTTILLNKNNATMAMNNMISHGMGPVSLPEEQTQASSVQEKTSEEKEDKKENKKENKEKDD